MVTRLPIRTRNGIAISLAHGYGRPVDDAQTTIEVVTAGRYEVWARTKDWVPAHHPGRFNVSINGNVIEHECGSHGGDWVWEHIGEIDLQQGPVDIALRDLTGFDGRCDAPLPQLNRLPSS